MDAIHVLLRHSIDYAGLFPPAELAMAPAVENYALYRSESHAWSLGRFIVPVRRLDEFDTAAQTHLPRRAGDAPWYLSALLGSAPLHELERLAAFNARHASAEEGLAVADVVEFRAASAAVVDEMFAHLPTGITAYAELPLDPDPAPALAALARHGGRAKVRTGGITPEAFPPAGLLARFLRRVVEARVPFKATAGLHHPVRAEHRLTYAPDSPTGTMHGFINLHLAAAFTLAGMADADVIALLEERDPSAIRFDGEGVEWRGYRLSLDALVNARERVFDGFGSCSFTEPIDDLTALGWLNSEHP